MAPKNSRFFTGEEIIKELDIYPCDLVDLILDGDLRDYITDPREIIFPFPTKDNYQPTYAQLKRPDIWRPRAQKSKEELIRQKLNERNVLNVRIAKKVIEAFMADHPEYKPHDAPYTTKDGETSPYLIKNPEENPYCSIELCIAVETWMFFYGPDSTYTPEKLKKKEIVTYLFEKHPDLFTETKSDFDLEIYLELKSKEQNNYLTLPVKRILGMVFWNRMAKRENIV